MDTFENILVIRLSSIGDILFTLPAVHALRDQFPGSRISYIAKKKFSFILEGFEPVQEVLLIDRNACRWNNPRGLWDASMGLAWKLRKNHYSLAVDFHGLGETGWISRLTGARQRWGCVFPDNTTWPFHQSVPFEKNVHPVDNSLRLLQQCGVQPKTIRNEYHVSPQAIEKAKAWLTGNGIHFNSPILFIQPYTSDAIKNWPMENYIAFANYWKSRGAQVIFGGSKGEQPALEAALQNQFLIATGFMPGLFKLSTLVVGGDTGMLHLANAMGTRVLMLISLLWAELTYPYGHRDWALTPPSGPGVAGITVKEAIHAAESILAT